MRLLKIKGLPEVKLTERDRKALISNFKNAKFQVERFNNIFWLNRSKCPLCEHYGWDCKKCPFGDGMGCLNYFRKGFPLVYVIDSIATSGCGHSTDTGDVPKKYLTALVKLVDFLENLPKVEEE